MSQKAIPSSKLPLSLPPDIHLIIIDHLFPIDIFHLQLTCHYFNAFIEDYAGPIWKACLRRYCALSNAYWPSFKDLSGAAQYKRACTNGARLWQAYGCTTDTAGRRFPVVTRHIVRFLHHGVGLSSDSAPNTPAPPVGTDNDDPGTALQVATNVPFGNIHYVPGGRFIVTSEVNGPVLFWDLDSQPTQVALKAPERTTTATLVAQHPSRNADGYVCSIFLGDEPGVLNMLYIAEGNTGAVPSRLPIPSFLVDFRVEVYEVMQVRYDEHSGAFGREITSSPRLSVVTQGSDEVYLEERFVVHAENGAVVIWDFQDNLCAGWGHNIEDVTQVLTSSQYILLLNHDGVHGFKIPPFVPPPDHGFVVVQSYASAVVQPAFFLPHAPPPLYCTIPRPVPSIGCQSSIEHGVPVFYEIFLASNPSADDSSSDSEPSHSVPALSATRVRSPTPAPFDPGPIRPLTFAHRYEFVLNERDPARSTLRHVETTMGCPALDADRPSLKAQKYAADWDYLWTVWEDTPRAGAISLACSPSMRRLGGDGHMAGSKSRGKRRKREIAENFWALYPVELGASSSQQPDSEVPVTCLGCEFDPVTGRALAFYDTSERAWIELYTFN